MNQSSFERFTNSRLYALGDKLGDVFLLSFFWLICSIPLVTMGPATSALYYAINKRYADKSETPLADYWRSFRQNLGQGIALTVILLLYLGATIFNVYVAFSGWNGIRLPSWYGPVAILLLLPFLFTALYVFPYLARFKNSVGSILFHSFTFSTMYTGNTFIMWLYVILSVAVMIFFFPALLFMPFICCYLCWRRIERDFGYALLLKKKREEAAMEEASANEEDASEDESDEDSGDSAEDQSDDASEEESEDEMEEGSEDASEEESDDEEDTDEVEEADE
ncbi:MAG: YesL family protein [Clostridiales bacterium]|nr:YesL family protein [Clostridiales bacterium]